VFMSFTLAFALQLRKKHWLASHCQRVGFNARPVSVVFVIYEVALGQVFLQVLLFLPVGDIPSMLHTLIHPSVKWSLSEDVLCSFFFMLYLCFYLYCLFTINYCS